MGLAGFFFVTLRIIQIIFLIPPVGMLSNLVHGYVENNLITPNFILVLFIVTVLALAWTTITLFFYAAARHNGYLLAFVDLGLFAALIAGVYELRDITTESCSNFPVLSYIGISLGQWYSNLSMACGMLKASFAFSIIEIIMFFNSFWLALLIHHHHRKEDRVSYRRESHTSRHSGRRSGSRSGGSRGGGSRSGSQRRDASRSQYNRRSYV